MGKQQKAKEMAEAKAARKATGKATEKAAGKTARQTHGLPMHIRTYLVPTSYLHAYLHGCYMGTGFGVKGDFSYHCMENTGHGQIIQIV